MHILNREHKLYVSIILEAAEYQNMNTGMTNERDNTQRV